jgi:hypothetical protein
VCGRPFARPPPVILCRLQKYLRIIITHVLSRKCIAVNVTFFLDTNLKMVLAKETLIPMHTGGTECYPCHSFSVRMVSNESGVMNNWTIVSYWTV